METKTGDRLKNAAQAYGKGYTCSQAVFCVYAEDMGIDQQTACRIMQGFGAGVCGTQGVCGVLAAVSAIISYACCDGLPGCKEERLETYRKIQQATEIFKKEYGGITCQEALRGETPEAFQCGMKVKDAVLIINQILAAD